MEYKDNINLIYKAEVEDLKKYLVKSLQTTIKNIELIINDNHIELRHIIIYKKEIIIYNKSLKIN